jgi:16S rRNA (cytosine1402-N4)-methyltransferase
MLQDDFHRPVMLKKAVDALVTNPKGIYVDCTVGGANHSKEILKRIYMPGRLVCLDADPDAIEHAKNSLGQFPNVTIDQVFFDKLDIVLAREGLLPVNGVIFDLGISGFQIGQGYKGFSYSLEGPLDMRFNPQQELNAEIVVNEYSEELLSEIFYKYGEEKDGKKISRAIIRARQGNPIKTTKQLAEIVLTIAKAPFEKKTLARIFQALRIEVNDELNRLGRALDKALEVLDMGGRLVTINYHSLEDRKIKEFLRYRALDCVCPKEFPRCICNKVSEIRLLTKKPLYPDSVEIESNPRARSAKMRVAEKIIPYGK